jgi:hypothetical protein
MSVERDIACMCGRFEEVRNKWRLAVIPRGHPGASDVAPRERRALFRI